MRVAIRLLCAVLVCVMYISAHAQEQNPLVQALVDAEIEKTKGMPPEQALSYIKTSATLRSLEVLALQLNAYRIKHGRYPGATSMKELDAALSPLFPEVRTTDYWGTEFRYVVAKNGKSYRLISAGADTLFDESSWKQPGTLATADEDAVLENGKPVRMWTVETQPGLGRRARVKPEARTHLATADARLAADDRAGALLAYIDAVTADPVAAELEAIRNYAASLYLDVPPPPPPPPPPPAPPASRKGRIAPPPVSASDERLATNAEERRRQAHVAALQQFLEIHPRHEEAERDLATVLPDADAESFVTGLLQGRPRDPELYAIRASIRMRNGRSAEALADLEKTTEIDAGNAQRFYTLGVAAHEAAKKQQGLARDSKRELLLRSLAAFARAEALRDAYMEALAYRSVVLRELATLEVDPAARKRLNDEADDARSRALEAMNSRR